MEFSYPTYGVLGVECSNHSVPTIFFNDLAQSEKVGLFHARKILPHLLPRISWILIALPFERLSCVRVSSAAPYLLPLRPTERLEATEIEALSRFFRFLNSTGIHLQPRFLSTHLSTPLAQPFTISCASIFVLVRLPLGCIPLLDTKGGV